MGGPQSFEDPDVLQKQEYKAPYTMMETAGQFASGVNEIIPATLGLPGDLAAAIQSAKGSFGKYDQEPQEPVKAQYGSEFFDKAIEDMGIDLSAGDRTAVTKAGNYFGMGMGMQAAVRGLLGKDVTNIVLKSGKKDVLVGAARGGIAKETAKRVGYQMTRPLTLSPGATTAAEFGGSAGAVAAGEGAEELFGEKWRMPFELIGGAGGAMTAYSGAKLAGVTLPKIKLNIDSKIAGIPIPKLKMEAGGLSKLAIKTYYKGKALTDPKTRVAKRLAEVSESPEDALRAIDRESKTVIKGVKQTPASKTADKHLMALEQEVINENPNLYNMIQDESVENYRVINQQLKKLYDDYPVEVVQRELIKDIDTQKALLETSLSKMRNKVKVAVASLGSNADRTTINEATSQIIEETAKKVKLHETQLWKNIDGTLPVSEESMNGVKSAYTVLANELDDSLIPAYLKNQLGTINADGVVTGGKGVRLSTLDGLKKLRTLVGSTVSSERSSLSPDWNKVRVLNNFRDSILDQMRVTDKSPALDTAIAFSRDFSQKFRRGVVGKIRGYDPQGGGRIPEKLTLENTVGTKGVMAGVAADDLSAIQSVGGKQFASQDPADLVQEYVKSRIGIATSEGKIRIEPAAKFLGEHVDLIRRYPSLGKQINAAIDMENSYKSLEREVRGILGSREMRLTEALTRKSPGEFARTILNTGSGTAETARIWAKLTPKGRKAMKGDFLEFLQRGARTAADDDGHYAINGGKMKGIYSDHIKSFGVVLSEGEKARLEKLMSSITESQFPKQKVPKVTGTMTDVIGRLLETPARVVGAKFGALLGGGNAGVSLQSASLGAARAKEAYKAMNPDRAVKLLNDMVLDEALYKDMLKYAAKIRGATKSGAKIPEIPRYSPLHGWMIANGLDQVTE